MIVKRLEALAPGLGTGPRPDICSYYGSDGADARPVLRVVSGLADGSDQIAFEAVLSVEDEARRDKTRAGAQTDFELVAVLPCDAASFRDNSEVKHKEAFNALLERCACVIELDGRCVPHPSSHSAPDRLVTERRKPSVPRAGVGVAAAVRSQRGSGKRSSYYSDYTFGVWRAGDGGEPELVPVGKAYSGFTDEELLLLDRWIRNHTTETFGPVRAVEPGLVFEVAFDAVQTSTRHKSGVAMRFPRIHRIRWDKPAAEAETLETVKRLIGGADIGASVSIR